MAALGGPAALEVSFADTPVQVLMMNGSAVRQAHSSVGLGEAAAIFPRIGVCREHLVGR